MIGAKNWPKKFDYCDDPRLGTIALIECDECGTEFKGLVGIKRYPWQCPQCNLEYACKPQRGAVAFVQVGKSEP